MIIGQLMQDNPSVRVVWVTEGNLAQENHKKPKGAGNIVQLIRHLPYRHLGLNLIPRNPVKMGLGPGGGGTPLIQQANL